MWTIKNGMTIGALGSVISNSSNCDYPISWQWLEWLFPDKNNRFGTPGIDEFLHLLLFCGNQPISNC